MLILANQENIYAVTGGNGYFAVQQHMCSDFGIDVFSRITKKELKNLTATREKSLTGSVLALNQNFRNQFNLFENDSFGKMYQEIKANLDKEILVSQLGFSEEDIKKEHLCIAKSSFRINKPISLLELLKLINGCEYILENFPAAEINQVEKLTKKKNQSLIDQLEDNLDEQLWQRYSNTDENDSIDFDLCPAMVEEYLTASEYLVKQNRTKNKKRGFHNVFGDNYVFPKLQNIDTLFEIMRHQDMALDDKGKFLKLIKKMQIFAVDDNGNTITRGDVFSHLLGDVSGSDGKRYFYVEKKWYWIKADFITKLNDSCKSFVQSNSYTGLDKSWNFPTIDEGKYNEEYISQTDTIVLDRVITEGIELCDIMKWDDNSLYLIHVKAKFGNSMRDLCSQVSIAANRIIEDRAAGWQHIEKVYDNMEQKKSAPTPYFQSVGQQADQYSKNYFCNLFKKKKIIFVLAVLDTAQTERPLADIDKFHSCIAKYSLQELVKKMAGSATELEIAQIHKTVYEV